MSLSWSDSVDEGLIQPLGYLVDGIICGHRPSENSWRCRNAQKGKHTHPGQPDRCHAGKCFVEP